MAKPGQVPARHKCDGIRETLRWKASSALRLFGWRRLFSGWGLGGDRRRRLECRIDPAGMGPAVEAFRHFGVDMTLADQAAERRLDMRARAAEAIVKVEMAEGGIEVVAPEQADHPAAEPDAFRIAGGTRQHARGVGDFIDLLLAFFGGVAGRLVLVGH